MQKLHLCYYELSEATRKNLRQMIKDNASIVMGKNYNEKRIDFEIDKLFELNNAGIDIDIFNWM